MRVLLVRLDGIGDAAVCVPLFAALREAGHEIGVALTTRNAGLFAPGAVVAEHVLERIPWPAHGSTPESTARASAEIAAMRYDVALIASEEPEAFALAAPIRERVGFTTGLARPLKTLWVRARTTRAVSRSQHAGGEEAHEAEVMYRLGTGLVRGDVPRADAATLRPLLIDAAVSEDARAGAAIIVQAGPKWLSTGVPAGVQRAVFERLAPDARIVAAPGDAAHVREQTGIQPETFGGLRAWVDALASARAVVTVDTGAAHVAGMLGTPVVDVFPDAGFEAQVRRWRPWASPYRAFRASEVDGGAGSRFIEAVLDGF
ncbi:MAG TPA: glycosyltransferase family 9 protein [Candidatus Limnocylindrales bacterium]|nr:glycosyltransferase family 9 protein [Candidatus Limnocylindrales bacterium]